MPPRDDDRRTYVCSAIMLGVPIAVAAAQVAMDWLIKGWAPQFTSAIFPSWFVSGAVAGAATAWAALLLPGRRTPFTVVVIVSGFIVGTATYLLFAWAFMAYRGL